MKFDALPIAGAWSVGLQRIEDSRGFFARSFCRREFSEHGLDPQIDQCNVSWNRSRGTLRGMHFQRPPREEAKLVRCVRGAAYDVVLDLRPDSATFRRWCAVEITAENRAAVYVPPGCGHGFQTLTDDTELLYYMSDSYDASLAGGVRWNDPVFAIDWPIAPPIVSEKDDAFPDYSL